MARSVFCEYCDYELVGLLEQGETVVCPECGETVKGRWFPRRVRVGLGVLAAVSPMLAGLGLLFLGPAVHVLRAGGWWMLDIVVMANGLAGVLLPPGAAWWLWNKSARRRVDFVDIACLAPVAWVLNSLSIWAGLAIVF